MKRLKKKQARKNGPSKKSSQRTGSPKLVFVLALAGLCLLAYYTYQKQVGVPHASKKPAAALQRRPPKAKTVYPFQKPSVVWPLPRKTPSAFPVTSAPPPPGALLPRMRLWTSQPKLVFVIDDMGNHSDLVSYYRLLGDHVTYAVLPVLRYSEEVAALSRQTGAEVILHQPLESRKNTIPGPGLIVRQMSDSQIRETFMRNLASVPYRVGMNNHMGSLGTSDLRVMEILLAELSRRGFFFLDSKTTSQTVSALLGGKLEIPVLTRDIFLDNEDSKAYVQEKIKEMQKIARQKGYAISIGHDRANTLSAIYEEIPKLTADGFQVVSLAELARHR